MALVKKLQHMVRGVGSQHWVASEVEAVNVLYSFKTPLNEVTDLFLICIVSLSAHNTPITSQTTLAYHSQVKTKTVIASLR